MDKKGILAGAFDLIHPGYIKMFTECKNHCEHLTVALHEDPNTERKKLPIIHTIEERKEILLSIRYIDDIVVYKTEKEWYNILANGNYDVRFLGGDYLNKNYTGQDLPIKIHFLSRDHNYSTTDLKQKIANSLKEMV
jgi:glycerol-3-phosphate cytidylyltransferase